MKEHIDKFILDSFLNKDDIEILVVNKNVGEYFDNSIKYSYDKLHKNNPDMEKRLFAKFLFNRIINYNKDLGINYVKFTDLCLYSFYDNHNMPVFKTRLKDLTY